MPVGFNRQTGKVLSLPELPYQLFKAAELLEKHLQKISGYDKRSPIVDRIFDIKQRANDLYLDALAKAEGRAE